MKTRASLFVLAALALLSFVPIKSATWSVDSTHARLGFSISHLMVSEVDGAFKKFDASVTASQDDFSDAVVRLTADVNSIDTDNDQRDAHLKNPDFFDVANYPTLTFVSKSFKRAGDKKYVVTGDLTMHGVTKQVQLDAVYNTAIHPYTKSLVAGFKVTGKIKRSDFNIGTSFLSNALGDEVSVVANAEFIKNPDAN